MDITNCKYYEYYDTIYADKDYPGDIENVIRIYAQYGQRVITQVLDVGCGTGNHSVELALRGYQVLGVDIDAEMITRARLKAERISGEKLRFWQGNISELDESGFELAVSMFYVVNYIQRLEELLDFFAAIHQRLTEGGIYVFDSWNGLAAQLDPPHHEVRQSKGRDGTVIEVRLEPSMNRMEERVVVNNLFSITTPDGSERNTFEYAYTMRLWTPQVLREILQLCNFNVLHISKQGAWEQEATEQDWKIMFICRKR